ncbi:hypothetical protein CEUSTIGMA_g11765.t1 [Chlamydomonas eustigma]|uniref:Exportin-T n=1 Tax=Chlamydomonas eustigma TaxID=1157962 RepID=A0A250XMU3_9CHLO|nr:hypothetical protein CEUSTIGMA_g11765.t1 [Chlamydomonas eustigma]|eukprot:GAX84343.1 hypothetical protein CEUSTIGMA_g11765.t1 [Chlamydomonas eustigma]
MSDDFERALLITFDYTGGVDATLKERANVFISDIKKNPDVWRLCCERFSVTAYIEIKFWCLQTLQEVIRSSYTAMSDASKTEIKSALLTWLQRDCLNLKSGLPTFLRNKLAQTIVAVLQFEYPSCWPGFFHDLISAMNQGEGIVDMFCRVLVSVDEDLVSLDIPRSQDESKLSMHIKDSMREHSISDIASAWYALVDLYRTKRPALATSVLQTMQRYVPWIDISLVAHPKFVALLLSLLESSDTALAAAAADCLTEVVSKRMDALPKLTLFESMGIVSKCANWSGGIPLPSSRAGVGSDGAEDDGLDEEGEGLLGRCAHLLATLATEILDSLKRLENGVISLAAIGLSVDDEAAVEVKGGSELGSRQLAALFPVILTAFKSGVEEVALPLMPFMHAYTARLKVQQKRSQGLPAEATMHIHAILEGLAMTSRYPVDSACEHGGVLPVSGPELSAAREEQAEVEEKRRDLFSLFKNISKIAFAESVAFVTAQLQKATSPPALGRPEVTFQEAEMAVVLLYELGEGAPEEALKSDSGALGQLAVALMQANLPSARHRLVAMAVLETYVRYSKILQHHQNVIPSAIMTFLDERGMGHPAEDVSTRACYLFARLSKLLRNNLRPFVPTILQSLHPHLSRIATRPLAYSDTLTTMSSNTSAAASGTGRDGGAQRVGAALVDDRLYVFEAVGLLLGQEELPAEEQYAMLTALLQPLREQIDSNLAVRSFNSPGLILQALEAIVRINKGFKTDLCIRARPQLGRMFMVCLETAIQVLHVYPSHKVLRNRFISSVHRLVECLGTAVLPMLPAALEALVTTQVDAPDLTEVLSLTNQLILKFKEAMQGLLQSLLPVLIARLHTVLTAEWEWSGRMAAPAAVVVARAASTTQNGSTVSLEEGRECGELQRSYYSLLHVLVHTGLSRSLLNLPPGILDVAIKAVTQGAATHVDATVRRTCMQILQRLVSDWCGGPTPPSGSPSISTALTPSGMSLQSPQSQAAPLSEETVPGFRSYAIEHFAGGACLVGLMVSGAALFDTRDAATMALIGEAAVSIKMVHGTCGGDQLLSHMCGNVLPSLGCPSELQQQLAYHIRESEAKELKECLRAVMSWRIQSAQQSLQVQPMLRDQMSEGSR